MSLRTMSQKPLNVSWRALPRQKLSAREILRLWFTAILVQAIARWEEIRKRRDKEAQRYFNDARDEYDSSSEKSEECHKSWVMFDYINHAINDRYVALS